MPNRVELFLKLALAAKTAAEVTPATAPIAPITPIGPSDLAPGLLNAKHPPITPGSAGTEVPGIKPIGPSDLAPGDLNAVHPTEVAPQGFQTPEWLNHGLDWAKGFGQNPMQWDKSHMLAAGGVGAAGLLGYMMSGNHRRRRKHAALNIGNVLKHPMKPGDAAEAIQTAAHGIKPITTGPMVSPSLAKAGPDTTREAIRRAADRPVQLSPTDAIRPITTSPTHTSVSKPTTPDITPEMQTSVVTKGQTGTVSPAPQQVTDTLAPASSAFPVTSKSIGENDPHAAPLYQAALEKTPPIGLTTKADLKPLRSPTPEEHTAGPDTASGTEASLIPKPRPFADLPTDRISNPDGAKGGLDWAKEFGQSPKNWDKSHVGTAVGAGTVGAAGAGAAVGAAAQKSHDASQAAAANPIGATTPKTHTGNVAGGAGDWIQKYLGGFAQSPTKWDSAHIATGVGAGALLAYLLSRGGNDDE